MKSSVKERRVVVCGSRSWTDAKAIHRRLSGLDQSFTVIEGGAQGADTIAYEVALGLNLGHQRVTPEWSKYGKRAGFLRNLAMLDLKPHLVIAFWDGESKGTAHTIAEAKARGIPVEVITNAREKV